MSDDETVQATFDELNAASDASTAAQSQRDGLHSLPLEGRIPFGETFGGERNLYQTLGYDDDPGIDDYWNRYLRQDIARTIVDAPAKTTWREEPEVVDDDSDDNQTPFEADVETLFREHELLARLEAVDRLAGIGHFGLLIIGVKDGRPLSSPVATGRLNGPDDVAYLMPVAEDRVDEWELVDDDSDERFGLPETYDIDFGQRRRNAGEIQSISDDDIRTVHWSRVVHVPAGNTLDNVLMGRPRLEAVYNRLQDLEKVIGASAETFWRAADYGLALQADPEHAGQMNAEDRARTEEELRKWYHGLQPFLRLAGFEVEKLGGEDVNPTGVVEQILKLIAGETGIPQRILTGSERGELASTQDRASWLGRIGERQVNFAEPKIFRAFIDRMVDFGVVSEASPAEDEIASYEVEWPNLFELSDVERAEVSAKKAKALKDARDPASAQPILTPGEVRQEVFGLDPELGAEVDIDEGVEGGGDPLEDLLPDVPENGDRPGDEEPLDEDDEQVQEQFRYQIPQPHR